MNSWRHLPWVTQPQFFKGGFVLLHQTQIDYTAKICKVSVDALQFKLMDSHIISHQSHDMLDCRALFAGYHQRRSIERLSLLHELLASQHLCSLDQNQTEKYSNEKYWKYIDMTVYPLKPRQTTRSMKQYATDFSCSSMISSFQMGSQKN